jgi:DNA-binding transcriptional ArsR family regulator
MAATTVSADKIFEALSSAPRRRILAYLSQTDMTAGEIARRFAGMMSQPAISKHLSVLENAGLVWREKRGQNVHYGLKEDALTGTLVHFLAEVCPRSRPFRKESAAAARRKKHGGSP